MPDEANNGILDRSLFRAAIAESFTPQLDTLEQIVNYGTNLVPRCFASSERGIPAIVCLSCFLKHAVSSLDAIHILSREGATLACYSHLRSLMEVDLYLRWIFQSDYTNRATAYFVWCIRRSRTSFREYLEGTHEHESNTRILDRLPLELLDSSWTQEKLRAAIAQEEERLESPETRFVNAIFEEWIATSGNKSEPRWWYRPFGVRSLHEMAKRVDEETAYDVFYRQFSQATHGLSLDHQIHFNATGNEVVFDHIRTLDKLDEILKSSFTYAVRIYHLCLGRYRPAELDAFSRKYTQEWRATVLSIPKIRKDGGTFTVTPKGHSGEAPPRGDP